MGWVGFFRTQNPRFNRKQFHKNMHFLCGLQAIKHSCAINCVIGFFAYFYWSVQLWTLELLWTVSGRPDTGHLSCSGRVWGVQSLDAFKFVESTWTSSERAGQFLLHSRGFCTLRDHVAFEKIKTLPMCSNCVDQSFTVFKKLGSAALANRVLVKQ